MPAAGPEIVQIEAGVKNADALSCGRVNESRDDAPVPAEAAALV
jgi:hypothetical protein